MERAVRKPKNAVMTLAMVLLCLVLASSYLVAGMLAKYTTSDSSAEGGRVAKFVFTLSDKASSHMVDLSDITKPGDSAVYEFVVSSVGSEVTEEYHAQMQLNGSMPLVCTLTDGSSTATLDRLDASDVNEPQTLAANQVLTGSLNRTEKSFKLTVEWPAEEGRKELKYASGSAVGELILIVTGVQVD